MVIYCHLISSPGFIYRINLFTVEISLVWEDQVSTNLLWGESNDDESNADSDCNYRMCGEHLELYAKMLNHSIWKCWHQYYMAIIYTQSFVTRTQLFSTPFTKKNLEKVHFRFTLFFCTEVTLSQNSGESLGICPKSNLL